MRSRADACSLTARSPPGISKNPEGGHLTFTVEAFGAFLAELKAGELDS
jgi:hypothetical protein